MQNRIAMARATMAMVQPARGPARRALGAEAI